MSRRWRAVQSSSAMLRAARTATRRLVDGVALGGDGAHLGVDDGGETFDVGGIGAAEMVDLVVDVDRDGLALGGLGRGLGGFEGLVHRLFHRVSLVGLEEFVDLLEHFFYAKADVFALFGEGG